MYIWIKVEPQQEHDQHTYVGQGNGAKRNLGTWIAVRCNDWKIHIKGTPKHANTYRWSKMKCKLVYVHRTNKRDSGIGEHQAFAFVPQSETMVALFTVRSQLSLPK